MTMKKRQSEAKSSLGRELKKHMAKARRELKKNFPDDEIGWIPTRRISLLLPTVAYQHQVEVEFWKNKAIENEAVIAWQLQKQDHGCTDACCSTCDK